MLKRSNGEGLRSSFPSLPEIQDIEPKFTIPERLKKELGKSSLGVSDDRFHLPKGFFDTDKQMSNVEPAPEEASVWRTSKAGDEVSLNRLEELASAREVLETARRNFIQSYGDSLGLSEESIAEIDAFVFIDEMRRNREQQLEESKAANKDVYMKTARDLLEGGSIEAHDAAKREYFKTDGAWERHGGLAIDAAEANIVELRHRHDQIAEITEIIELPAKPLVEEVSSRKDSLKELESYPWCDPDSVKVISRTDPGPDASVAKRIGAKFWRSVEKAQTTREKISRAVGRSWVGRTSRRVRKALGLESKWHRWHDECETDLTKQRQLQGK